jgi:hypothetical protein
MAVLSRKRDSHLIFWNTVQHRPPINAHIPMYAENNDFLDRPAPFEHLNVLNQDVKSRFKRGLNTLMY